MAAGKSDDVQEGSRKKHREKDGDSSARGEKDSDQDSDEPEEQPRVFVLPGDDTGKGIEYGIMSKTSWKTLQDYCEVGVVTWFLLGARGGFFSPPPLSGRVRNTKG